MVTAGATELFSTLTANALIAAIFILLLIWYIHDSIQNRDLPPGPRGLPVLGVWPFLRDYQCVSFAKYGEHYGDVITVPLLGQRIIVLNSADVIREAFSQNVFSARPRNFRNTELTRMRGFLGVGGPKGREQRRFALSTLRDFGMGKMTMEAKIQEELGHLLQAVRDMKGEPFDFSELFRSATSNIISSVVFDKRYEYRDIKPGLSEKSFDHLTKTLELLNLLTPLLNVLRLLPGDILGYWKLTEIFKDSEGSIRSEVDLHKESYDPQVTRSYVDAFLHKMRKGDNATFTDMQLVISSMDLFNAGMETTASTLRWGILYLILNPDVQTKLKREINEQIGDVLPQMSHRLKLPYVAATINETLRRSSLAPIALTHQNEEEVFLRGYRIPKRSTIIPNLWNVHNNPKNWKDPEQFIPNRFLENGRIVNTENLAPFSIGKRACIGESLAMMELFIFFTGLLQEFTFLPEADDKLPSDEHRFKTLNRPKPFRVRAVSRD